MDKVVTAQEAVERIKDGSTIMIGGFGGHGSPHTVIDALVKKGAKNLTLICNDAGTPGFGAGALVANHQIKKMYVSILSPNPQAQEQLAAGELEVCLIPQGSLAEMIRAGGYGLGGVLTRTGIGTQVEEGKQKVTVKGETYLLEEPLKADVALIYASKGDRAGNAVYHGSARAHSPSMAAAADYTILEVGELKEVGEIHPDEIHTQSVLVGAVVEKGGKG